MRKKKSGRRLATEGNCIQEAGVNGRPDLQLWYIGLWDGRKEDKTITHPDEIQ